MWTEIKSIFCVLIGHSNKDERGALAEVESIMAQIDEIDRRIDANQRKFDRMKPITQAKIDELKRTIEWRAVSPN